MYQVFELQRAAFDASVSKMVNEYEKKFVPQAEAISAYDVEIDERTKEIDNSISLIRELIKTELSNCDLMDEVLNYLKIYDHSLVIDARNVLNGADVIIDLVEKDLDIINKTNYDERDKDDTDNDRPTFIEKENIDDDEADTRHELIKDIIDPVAGEEGPLGSKTGVDTDAITEAIKEKNKEEAEAKQKAADEAKTEADIARQKAEEAERRKREAQEALKEAMDDLVHTMAEAKKLADAGATIGVVVSDTNIAVKPGVSTTVNVKPDELNNVINNEVVKEKINAAIEAAKDAIANGASHDEAVNAAAAAANKVEEEHSSIVDKLSDIYRGRTQEYKEATSEAYAKSAVNYVENQIAAQEAAAEVPGAAQRLKEAQEKLGEASAEAKELQQAYEQAKQEADIRQAEADAAADSGAENSGGGEGNCDSSCDSTGCDDSCDHSCDDSCRRDSSACRNDSCDEAGGGTDCDSCLFSDSDSGCDCYNDSGL